MPGPGIHLQAFWEDDQLAGYAITGRRPADPSEWACVLASVLHHGVLHPRAIPHPTLFAIDDATDIDSPEPDLLAVVHPIGAVLEQDQLPELLMTPLAVAVAHPLPRYAPGERSHGCLLIPGMPQLGMSPQAAWASVAVTGEITQLRSRSDISVGLDVDLTVLS